ncbi:MAG: hypothetical protein ACXVEB_17475, partial [Bacteroidia bacterium]
MKVESDEYQHHQIFKEAEEYMQFYKDLAMLVFPFMTQGTSSMANIDSYIFTSIRGTIDSIQITARNGRLNDAYSLLRKYYDSVIINTYATLYLEENVSIENFIVEKIQHWLHGTEQLPEYRVMSQYIRNSKKVLDLNNLLFKNDLYKSIRERCNDHTHYNYFRNLLLNDNEVYLKNRINILNQLLYDLRHVFLLHLSYVFFLNQHYMGSPDYRNCLEFGIEP